MTPSLIMVDPADLRPNPWNTNIVSPENERKLDESMRRLDIFKPVLARELEDGSLEILGGEHRAKSAIRIGKSPIPVFNLGPMADQRAKEIGLADNARYGVDDTLELSDLLKSLGEADHLASFLPYTETDLKAIFSSSDIALDDLGLSETGSESPPDEPPAARAPKTHAIMRFKIGLADREKVAKLIAKTQKRFGLTGDDELTNAGDALVHLLLGGVDGE